MGHKDTIISFIIENKGFYCDDCLSKLCSISPRQTVFQVCTKLSVKGSIKRGAGVCSYCGSEKTVNCVIDVANIEKIKIEVKAQSDKKVDKTKIINEEYHQDGKEFIEVKLKFESYDITNTFSRFNAHTLREILSKNKYRSVKDECYRDYKKYIDMELGAFLYKLKEEGNLFYKSFLNPYGDLFYCKFKMEETPLAKYKGIYMYKCNGIIKYIGRVKGDYDFYQRINAGYANISPKNCYIDGQATNCHINAMINRIGGEVKFYIMPLDNDEEICSLERQLIEEKQPEWNIALK